MDAAEAGLQMRLVEDMSGCGGGGAVLLLLSLSLPLALALALPLPLPLPLSPSEMGGEVTGGGATAAVDAAGENTSARLEKEI